MWRTTNQYPRLRMHIATDPCATQEPGRPVGIPPSWKFEPYEKGDDGPNPAAWIEPQAEASLRVNGYCGLAGRPEALLDAERPYER